MKRPVLLAFSFAIVVLSWQSTSSAQNPLEKARSERDAALAEVTKLKAQVAQLQAGGGAGGNLLQTARSERDAALAKVADLTRQLAAGGGVGGNLLKQCREEKKRLEKELERLRGGSTSGGIPSAGCCGEIIYYGGCGGGWSTGHVATSWAISQPQTSLSLTAARTWVYGDRPKLVTGTLQGMNRGHVELRSNQNEVVRVPIQDLSSTDQRIVTERLGQGHRLWSDNSEQFHRNAKFARVAGPVVLETKQGQELQIQFERLSAADQCIVRQLWKQPIPAALPGSLPEPERYVARK